MRVYWDSSALVLFFSRGRLAEISGVTRSHSLAELYSALTGGGFDILTADGKLRHRRLSLSAAAVVVGRIAAQLEFVELSAEEILSAIQGAKKKGAQGGRIHDLLHALAAEKAGADELWTIDRFDFSGLGKVPLRILA